MSDRDTITLPREVVEEAVEALQYMTMTAEHCVDNEIPESAIAALRTALAAEQPKPEPVAWQCREHGDDEWFGCSKEAYGINPSRYVYRPLYAAPPEDEALRRDAERWQHWRDSHGFAKIDHEGGRCFVTLICDCDDPDQVRAKRFAGEDSFEWLDAFTDAAMEGKR